MAEALEVKDMSRMLWLVMPSPRHPQQPRAPHAAGHSNLAPIEMLARSIHFKPPVPSASGVIQMQQSSSKPLFHHHPVDHHPTTTAGIATTAGTSSVAVQQQLSFLAPAWATPGGYALCGLGLGLCNLIAPGYMQSCAHLLCPLWTLALGLHVLCVSQQPGSGEVWAWGGALTLLLLPFVIMVAAPAFVGFYLLVFAVFASGMFWKHLQGAHFILVWICWAGLLLACALSIGVQQPHMHLSVASFFSISLGVLNSGGYKVAVRVVWDGPPLLSPSPV